MFSNNITNKTHNLIKNLRHQNIKLVSAESCTGGLFSASITEIPGSSDVFERGFITYSNESKTELLTVPTYYFEDFGAVSKETAIAMAEGALLLSKANLSISITGIAGPEGGTIDKPVGTVFIASSLNNKTICEQQNFSGGRFSIRMQAVEAALDLAISSF